MSDMTTALNAAPEADAAPRKLPEILPAWCLLHHDGMQWREWLIRLPETATLVDLNETPDLWKAVQGSNVALRTFDRVTIVSWAEDWMVEARVTNATKSRVEIAIIKRYDLAARHDRLPQDDTYRVRWFGNGYGLERKSDKLRVSPIVATVAECERAMSAKYSRAV
jgi:hypothetical protein